MNLPSEDLDADFPHPQTTLFHETQHHNKILFLVNMNLFYVYMNQTSGVRGPEALASLTADRFQFNPHFDKKKL